MFYVIFCYIAHIVAVLWSGCSDYTSLDPNQTIRLAYGRTSKQQHLITAGIFSSSCTGWQRRGTGTMGFKMQHTQTK